MIDIHSHILPLVDDGAKSWDIALDMCRMAAADGIEHMVATPHSNDRYAYDRVRLLQLLGDLRQRSENKPQLSLGCDFHLSYENIQRIFEKPDDYTIEGGRYLLVELSNYSIPAHLAECFTQLGDKGITPIITHPERNPILQRSPQQVLRWVEQGCAVQITASVLTGSWGDRASSVARWLLEREAVHFLATDAHDVRHRAPVLSTAREAAVELCGADVAHALVDANPRAVVTAQPLPYFPDPVMKE